MQDPSVFNVTGLSAGSVIADVSISGSTDADSQAVATSILSQANVGTFAPASVNAYVASNAANGAVSDVNGGLTMSGQYYGSTTPTPSPSSGASPAAALGFSFFVVSAMAIVVIALVF